MVTRSSSWLWLLSVLTGNQLAAEPLPKPHEAAVTVLVNQVGYDTRAAKVLVLQVRDPQREPAGSFALIDESETTVFQGHLTAAGRIHAGTPSDWRAVYWTGDFTRFCRPGKYWARVQFAAGSVRSFPFELRDRLLLRRTAEFAARFFYWQRCGYAIPGVHAACHLDDGQLAPELGGGHRDVTGGWHDAGDYNKYNGYTPVSVYALASLARFAGPILGDQARRQALDEARWGGEFIRKMWQPGKGIMYLEVFSGWTHWGPPERETDGIPGTADDRPIRGEGANPMAAAAMAALASVSGAAPYCVAAEDLWRGCTVSLDQSRSQWTNPNPHMLLADLELHAHTGQHRYLEDARRRTNALLAAQAADGLWQPDIGEYGIRPAALACYAVAYPRSPLTERVTAALRRWLDRSLQIADNPFQITPYADGVYFRPYKDQNAWYVGQNTQYLSHAWALYLTATLLKDTRARRLADRQIDWVLGANPLNLCMMEGRGSLNLPLYHHAYTGNSRRSMEGIPGQQRGAIPGAIPNGLCRPEGHLDRPHAVFAEVTRLPPAPPRMNSTEPWLPHNAYYVLAMIARAQCAEPADPR